MTITGPDPLTAARPDQPAAKTRRLQLSGSGFWAALWGSRSGKIGVILVGITLLGALVGYYGLVAIRYGYGPSLSGAVLLWLVAAVVGGPVFGVVGAWWRGPDAWRRAVGPALLGASAIAEGVYLSGIEPVAAATPGFSAVGLALPVVLGRSREDRVRGLVALVPCLGLGAAGFVATLALYGVLTGV